MDSTSMRHRAKGSTGASDSGTEVVYNGWWWKRHRRGKQKYTCECQPGSGLDSEPPLGDDPSSSDPSMGGSSWSPGGDSSSLGGGSSSFGSDSTSTGSDPSSDDLDSTSTDEEEPMGDEEM